MPLHTLYLCYFGLRQPLVQTQVLPYLRALRLDGIEVSLVTFEPGWRRAWRPEEIRECRRRLEEDQICWHALAYHKRPALPATARDVVGGAWFAIRLARRHRIDVLHARGHVAAAAAALAKPFTRSRLIFDIRGLLPEEYTDAGRWPAGGYLYRWTKAIERRLMAASDAFVVLTEKARAMLFPGCTDVDSSGRPIEVIPCCVDLDRFRSVDDISRDQVRDHLGVAGRRVLLYVGALGGWYLTNEMVDFLVAAHHQDEASFSLILTQSPPEMIAAPLREAGLSPAEFLIREVAPPDIPWYLKAGDLALSFIKPCYSKLASSPTKLAEYLAAGIPVVCNAGIGDVDEVVAGDRVGVILREFSRSAYLAGLEAADDLRREPGLAERCRASARNWFDLDRVGAARYRRLYRRLCEVEPCSRAAAEITR
jgi:glycosyltransferase involved in cell wall biosynthesis